MKRTVYQSKEKKETFSLEEQSIFTLLILLNSREEFIDQGKEQMDSQISRDQPSLDARRSHPAETKMRI